jgi:hyperosmotically inducible protein
MQRLLLLSLLLALSAAAVAQSSGMQNTQSAEPAITSNGPVIADYGKKPAQTGDSAETKIAQEVRHKLLMLPYYSLFDDLEYNVQGRTVTLSGDLTSMHGQTKQDAENAVKRIEGVDKVVNNIRVLPPSPLDDQARAQVYRTLVRTGQLSQYFWQAAPSIHIIVDNLHVTLKGDVNSEGDKNVASIRAKEVPRILSVTNELQVVKG